VIERALHGAGTAELKAHLRKFANKPFVEAMADFHLLLYLAKQPNLDLTTDIAVLAEAVKEKSPVPEGYKLIIDSIASI
jgi:nuclear protein localization protein 4 homolog